LTLCDSIRKRSKACFIPFFDIDVELFMRTHSIWVGGPPQKAAATKAHPKHPHARAACGAPYLPDGGLKAAATGTTEETGMNVGHHKKTGLE
jgi:hypothetical protein